MSADKRIFLEQEGDCVTICVGKRPRTEKQSQKTKRAKRTVATDATKSDNDTHLSEYEAAFGGAGNSSAELHLQPDKNSTFRGGKDGPRIVGYIRKVPENPSSNTSGRGTGSLSLSRIDPLNTTDYNFIPPRHDSFIGPMNRTIDHESFSAERNTISQEEPITTRDEEAVVYRASLPALFDLEFFNEYEQELEEVEEINGPQIGFPEKPRERTAPKGKEKFKKYVKKLINVRGACF